MAVIYPTLNYVASDYLADTNGKPASATFTRATTATRVNAIGQITTAASGVLRHDFDPVTGEYRGWLIEGQRTNLFLHSEDQTNGAYSGAAGVTVSVNAAVSPDGATTADKITEANATQTHWWRQLSSTFSASSTVTYSVFLKAAERSIAVVEITNTNLDCYVTADLSSGILGAVTTSGSNASNGSATIKSYGNGWYRVAVTVTTATVTQVYGRVYVDSRGTYAGNGTSGLYSWGWQIEVGAFATSYIPTVAATVTRNADLLTVATSAFAFNAAEGTLLVNFDLIGGPDAVQGVVSIDDGSGDNRVVIYRDSSANASVLVASGAASALGASISTLSNNTSARVALSYKVNDFAWCRDGGTVATDTAGAVPVSPTAVRIGATHAGQMLNGHLRHVAYFPRRLADADLQTVTE